MNKKIINITEKYTVCQNFSHVMEHTNTHEKETGVLLLLATYHNFCLFWH